MGCLLVVRVIITYQWYLNWWRSETPLCRPGSLWLPHIPVFVPYIRAFCCYVHGHDTRLLVTRPHVNGYYAMVDHPLVEEVEMYWALCSPIGLGDPAGGLVKLLCYLFWWLSSDWGHTWDLRYWTCHNEVACYSHLGNTCYRKDGQTGDVCWPVCLVGIRRLWKWRSMLTLVNGRNYKTCATRTSGSSCNNRL